MKTDERGALLELDGVSRSFGGVQAAAAVSFSLHEGSIHGLIGPNGAGKTTILNLISGLMRPEAGVIRFRGASISGKPAYQIARSGVRRTYQGVRLFGTMSARDNVLVGLHNQRSDSLWQRLCFSQSGRAAERATRRAIASVLDRTRLTGRDAVRARDLSYGEQRRLEIARALASQPALLLLDEPAAGMAGAEVRELGQLIRSVALEGTSVLLVEHNLELVMQVCDVVTVLDFGQVLASGPRELIRHDPKVIAAYLGAEA